MKIRSLKPILRLVAAPFILSFSAAKQGRIAASLFLLLTAPVFIVMLFIRQKTPRKVKDSAFTYTMR